MKQAIVLAANSSEAMIYKYAQEGKKLTLQKHISNDISSQQEQDLVTDRPGSMSAGGEFIQGKDAMSPSSTKEREKEIFAKHIVDMLNDLRTSNKVASIDIVADPSMLGFIRENMESPLRKLIDQVISKDGTVKLAEDLHSDLRERTH